MNRAKTTGYWMLHHKSILFIAFFVVEIGFLDRNSLLTRYGIHRQRTELERSLRQYRQAYQDDSRRLRELESDPGAIERIARERYFMKKADEDVYVIEYAGDEPSQTGAPEQ